MRRGREGVRRGRERGGREGGNEERGGRERGEQGDSLCGHHYQLTYILATPNVQ